MKRPVTYLMVLEDGTTFSVADNCKIIAVSESDVADMEYVNQVPSVIVASFASRAKYDGKLDMRLYTDDDIVIGH